VHKLREKLANIFEGRTSSKPSGAFVRLLPPDWTAPQMAGFLFSLCRSPVPRFLAALPFPIDGQTCAETTHRLFRIWVCP
jgi:hypothetical protein